MDESRLDTMRADDQKNFLENLKNDDVDKMSKDQQTLSKSQTSSDRSLFGFMKQQNEKDLIQEQRHSISQSNNQITDDRKISISMQQSNNKQPFYKDQQQQQKQSQISKEEIFKELSLKRKNDGYQQLKITEDQILKTSQIHIRICEQIFIQLIKRCQISENSMNTLIMFFKERHQQESANLKVLSVKNPAYLGLFQDPEPKQSKIFYPNLTKGLQAFHQLNLKQAEKLQILVNNIEKLISGKLEQNQNQYSKINKEYRNNMQKYEQKIQEQQLKVQKYRQKCFKVFSEMGQNNGINKQRLKDTFSLEKKLKNAFQELLSTQSQLGELIWNFWNEVLKQESLRLESLQIGLQTYIENHQEAYIGNKNSTQFQLAIKSIQECIPVKEVEQSLTVLEVVQPTNLLGDISNLMNLQPGTSPNIQDIKKFLTVFPQSILKKTTIQNHPLVLKCFNKVSRDNGTIMASWKKVIIIISIDNNILIFDSDDGIVPHQKPVSKFAIEFTDIIITKKQSIIVELRHVKPGVIYNSTEKQTLKFDSQDEFEELSFYISQYKSDHNKTSKK